MSPKERAVKVGMRMTLPLAGLLSLGLAGGADAAVGGLGATAPVVRALAVQAPVAVAASDRDRRGDGERRGRRSRTYLARPYYGSFGWYGGFGSFRPYLWSAYYYGALAPGWGPYGWGPGPVGYVGDAGALDINTRPKKASVYVDGELVGRVDGFDGFPRYLWLRDGSYRIAIFMEGYETLERRIRVQPGVVIRIDEDLVPGTAERPRPAPPKPAAAPPAPEGESWRVENRGRPIEQDQRREPARLRVEVVPADAVVYLDGRLLGSGAELANLHSALIVDPGTHRLEVIRPGYAAEVRAFEAEQGEDVSLRIVLREE